MAISNFSRDGFSVSIEPGRDDITIVPAGDLDLASVDHVEREVAELRLAGFERIVIDLRQLEFIDSRGLQLLIVLRNTAKRDGFELALVPGSDTIQKLFTLTATQGLFEWVC